MQDVVTAAEDVLEGQTLHFVAPKLPLVEADPQELETVGLYSSPEVENPTKVDATLAAQAEHPTKMNVILAAERPIRVDATLAA